MNLKTINIAIKGWYQRGESMLAEYHAGISKSIWMDALSEWLSSRPDDKILAELAREFRASVDQVEENRTSFQAPDPTIRQITQMLTTVLAHFRKRRTPEGIYVNERYRHHDDSFRERKLQSVKLRVKLALIMLENFVIESVDGKDDNGIEVKTKINKNRDTFPSRKHYTGMTIKDCVDVTPDSEQAEGRFHRSVGDLPTPEQITTASINLLEHGCRKDRCRRCDEKIILVQTTSGKFFQVDGFERAHHFMKLNDNKTPLVTPQVVAIPHRCLRMIQGEPTPKPESWATDHRPLKESLRAGMMKFGVGADSAEKIIETAFNAKYGRVNFVDTTSGRWSSRELNLPNPPELPETRAYLDEVAKNFQTVHDSIELAVPEGERAALSEKIMAKLGQIRTDLDHFKTEFSRPSRPLPDLTPLIPIPAVPEPNADNLIKRYGVPARLLGIEGSCNHATVRSGLCSNCGHNKNNPNGDTCYNCGV